MSEVTLTVETGRVGGSRASNRLRNEGKVPGIVYGHASDPVAVTVDRRELRHALTGEAGLNALITLVVDGSRQLSIVKELQRDPVRRRIQHVDFLLISRDEVLSVDVPIHLEGEPLEVLRNDGVIEHVLTNLTVSAKPGDIPSAVTYDISGMAVGDTVRVGDLELPEGVTTDVDPDEAVVSASIAAMEVPEPEVEAVEDDIAGEGEEEAAAPEGSAAGGTGADQS